MIPGLPGHRGGAAIQNPEIHACRQGGQVRDCSGVEAERLQRETARHCAVGRRHERTEVEHRRLAHAERVKGRARRQGADLGDAA